MSRQLWIICLAALALSLSLGTTRAWAQPSTGAPGAAPGPSPFPAPPTAPDIKTGILEDANSGRVFAAPTAMTAPAGTWSFNDYELLFLGGSYAFSDEFSASLTALAPITTDVPLVLIGSAKLRLATLDRINIALHTSVLHVSEGGDSDDDDFDFTVALFGGAATMCLDPACHSLVNGYLAAGFAIDQNVDQESVPFVVSLAYVQRVSDHLKLMVEGDFGFATGEVNDVADGLLLWYGARITSKNIGVDLGFARPICDGCNEGLALGFPLVTFTYRSI